MKKINSVENYIENHPKWAKDLSRIRKLISTTELVETLKWNAPVYTLNGKNVLGLGAFKHHFGIWFFNGVFLKDKHKVLVNAQEGKTKAMRQWRFGADSKLNEPLILSYINEAIQNQKLKKELKIEKQKGVDLPFELQQQLQEDTVLNDQFQNLTPYKQREYVEYIAKAKREATKQSRLIKIIPLIQKGMGLNDQYRTC